MALSSYKHKDITYFTAIASVFGALMGGIAGFYFGSQGLQNALDREKQLREEYENAYNSLSKGENLLKMVDPQLYEAIQETIEMAEKSESKEEVG